MTAYKQNSSESSEQRICVLIDWLIANQRCLAYKQLAQHIGIDTSQQSHTVWMAKLIPELTALDEDDEPSGAPRRAALFIAKKPGRPGSGFWRGSQPSLRRHREILKELYANTGKTPAVSRDLHEWLLSVSINVLDNAPVQRPTAPAKKPPTPAQALKVPSKSVGFVPVPA